MLFPSPSVLFVFLTWLVRLTISTSSHGEVEHSPLLTVREPELHQRALESSCMVSAETLWRESRNRWRVKLVLDHTWKNLCTCGYIPAHINRVCRLELLSYKTHKDPQINEDGVCEHEFYLGTRHELESPVLVGSNIPAVHCVIRALSIFKRLKASPPERCVSLSNPFP